MRWFAWLVAFCLVAAGVARPHAPLTLDRHDATVEDASDLASLVPRRPTPFTPDKRANRRLDLQETPAVIVARTFAPTVVSTAAQYAACTAAPRCVARSSRGPPAASSAASNPTT